MTPLVGEMESDWFLKVNPLGKIPVIEDGDFRLAESVAILKYLAMTRSTPDHWYPQDTRQRALVDEFMAWQHTGMKRYAADVLTNQVMIPLKTGQPVNTEKLNADCVLLDKVLNLMENYFLARGDFLAGNDVTLADLLSVPELIQLASVGYPLGRNRPRMAKWLEVLKARLQPHFDEIHKDMFAFGANPKFYKKDW